MRRETITLDRRHLRTALDRLNRALVAEDVVQSLRELHRVYALMAAADARRQTAHEPRPRAFTTTTGAEIRAPRR